MNTTLYLTATEKEIFTSLSTVLKEGWTVADESLSIHDTQERRLMRMHLLNLHDSKLTMLRDKALQTSTVDDLTSLIQNEDLSGVYESDLDEIFYAMGPEVITALIVYMLRVIETDKDIEGVASLSVIRHLILESSAA